MPSSCFCVQNVKYVPSISLVSDCSIPCAMVFKYVSINVVPLVLFLKIDVVHPCSFLNLTCSLQLFSGVLVVLNVKYGKNFVNYCHIFHYSLFFRKVYPFSTKFIYSTERWTKFNRTVTMNSSNGQAEKSSTWLWVLGGRR